VLFNSYVFLFLFLPFTLLGYYLIRNKRLQLVFLFLASTFFYAYWSTAYVFLLLFTVVLDFYIAKAIFLSQDAKNRKRLLLTSIILNLSILAFFKYYTFIATSINDLSAVFGPQQTLLPLFQLVLPIGISFYTFQSMSYVIDVYRKTSTAHAGVLEFASYVTLFPHQISGPLVRHNQIVPQLEDSKTYSFDATHFWRGSYFFIFGLAKKILIADRIAAAVDPLIGNMTFISNLEAWLAMIGYTLQLYFDFSGYTDMAIGLGLMMNIQFPQNFNSPYKALSITDFWKRWHMTLSSWLRDYLYISLGGNRFSAWKTYRNLILTMTIGGLWHGANWTFVVWGLLHGGALAFERCMTQLGLDFLKWRPLKWFLTFFFVNLAWIFFRSPDFAVASVWLQKIFFLSGPIDLHLYYLPTKYKDRFFTAAALALIIALTCKNTWERTFAPNWFRAVVLAILFAISLTYMGDESPFLYFQF
jgi:alginate O-acetyltransferase complex protein AlgI